MSLDFYFCGCSFTLGHELKDLEETRYSKLVSDHFNANEINEARGGGSNQRIVRKFIEAVAREKIDYVFIMWSSLDRFEHWSGREALDKGYDPVTANRIFPEQAEDKKVFTNHLGQYRNRGSVRKALADYMLEVRTRQHQVAEYFNFVLTIQTICKAKKIPYSMSNYQYKQTQKVVEIVMEDLKKENHQAYPWMLETCNLIDWNAWLKDKDFGFLEFAQERNFAIGPDGHPLEEAHRAFSKLICADYDRRVEAAKNEN